MEQGAKIARLDEDLSRRLHHALTAEKEALFKVMEEPSTDVLQAALKNPLLDENHVAALLKRRDLSEDVFRRVYKSRLFGESHLLKVAMARNQKAPASIVQAVLPHLHLFELIGLCYLSGVSADLKLSVERCVIQRLPATPLGDKLTLARRGTETILAALLKEGCLQVVEACLSNPRLKESAVFQFLTGPSATPETISAIARHQRWNARPNVRLAVLRNRNTPLVWFSRTLPSLNNHDVRNLLLSRQLNPVQQKAAQDELNRRGLR